MHLKFKNAEDLRHAVADYDGKSADGHVLTVSLKRSTSIALNACLAGGGGASLVGESVDMLMDEEEGLIGS